MYRIQRIDCPGGVVWSGCWGRRGGRGDRDEVKQKEEEKQRITKKQIIPISSNQHGILPFCDKTARHAHVDQHGKRKKNNKKTQLFHPFVFGRQKQSIRFRNAKPEFRHFRLLMTRERDKKTSPDTLIT
jgi:hypothetical protein